MTQTDPVKILLVDDQPAKLLSYEVILGELGETLLKASSARDALAQLLKHDVGVVLVDVQMPDLDGFELAAIIREHPRFQQTALIFVSAVHLSDVDRIKGYEAGGVDYVPVPIIPDLLRAKVRVFAELHRKTRELERLNGELERRVGERTAALEQSRRALEELNRQLEARIEQKTREREEALSQLFEAQKIDTIGQLTGGIAHDFNNLLMAMLGSLELLKKRIPDDPRAIRLLDNATKGAQRGAALTQRLLAFARRQELKPEAVRVSDLVLNMGELLKGSLGPTITIVQHLPDDLGPVMVDANQFELALLNLALNARDAMPDGGAITISAAVEEVYAGAADNLPPGQYIRLSVTDTGSGMDAATLARAVEPFFTTKGTGKGTGLGLSMVQGLAAQSGGGLRIQSRPGQGTRVDVLLPRAEEPAAPATDTRVATLSVVAGRVTILLVDDDALVSTGTAAMLEDLGHEVIEASTGDEALALLSSRSGVDMVITDHAMPGMTGAELAKIIRVRFPELPIILATGYADLPSATEPISLPRLSKPYLQKDLEVIIAQNLRVRSAIGDRSKLAGGA
ncbi:MAG TPA: response regulator [Caulobacteraceae bacterium]|nr:response regulator [Caulobacteraceae bacterium]